MKTRWKPVCGWLAVGCGLAGSGSVLSQSRPGLAEVLGVGTNLRDPGERARVVGAMREVEGARRSAARAQAARRGLPARAALADGRVMELVDWVGGQPLYLSTSNSNAAISTGANLLRFAPHSLTGAGVRVGVWDGGAVRASHQEFGQRVVVMDGAGDIDHATHVAGTIAANGIVAMARGMAASVSVDSYDWNNDISEMTARGAAAAGEAGRLYLSNHSYNYITGWNYLGDTNRMWEWHGSGPEAASTEDDFGKYNTHARDTDSLAFNAPYYLIFHSAGNERTDQPSTGQMVALVPGGPTVAYDVSLHPKGDGAYRGGFDTIGFNALAKNVLTVGSVADAVAGGLRDASRAGMSEFSSWGPTDDGRIKPDLVANGDALYSSTAGTDAAYKTFSGTSMATPNACGSAALLIELYSRLFPGQVMRASTLKGLLIHTASDLGTAGPDYKYGWGLVDVKGAADLIQGALDEPDRPALIEGGLTPSLMTRVHTFAWDGVSPIRATLCWTDPAGPATTASDSRSPRLVNDLNLKLIDPAGFEYRPYVMPFVGTWDEASMALPAVTGVNTTDTVEQVLLAAPPAAGVYRAVVTYSGTLALSVQAYSLLLSGTAPSGPLPPSVVAVTPDAAEIGTVPVSIAGSSFAAGAAVKFTLAGQPDVPAVVTAVSSTALSATVNTTEMISGRWNVVVSNPDGQSGSLSSGFAVIGTLWKQNFDPSAPGWTANASLGSTHWSLVTTQSQSPSSAWFAAGPSSRNTDNLVSESISIPANASRLRVSFWHRYSLENGNDGGVLEFSIDGGTWFQVSNSGIAEAFIAGGYTTILSSGGTPSTRNQFAGKPAWSGSTGSSFSQVVVALNDTGKYAGKSLRARWRLGTNNSVASPGGWYVDSVALTGVAGAVNQPPSVVAEATPDSNFVTDDSVGLSVSAVDDGGESGLTYTWSASGGRFDRAVSFSENGGNRAATTLATFAMAGRYSFQVIVRDAAGLSTSSTTEVSVETTPAGLIVSPAKAAVATGSSQSFAATVVDQFGDPVADSYEIAWAVNGGGTVDASGLFTAQSVGGPFTLSASTGEASGTAAVTVTGMRLADWQELRFSPEETAAGMAGEDADPDQDGLDNLTEYGLGTDPLAFTHPITGRLDFDGLALAFTRPEGLPDVVYLAESSSDLTNWSSVPLVVVTDGPVQSVRALDPSASGAARRFIQLRIVRAPVNEGDE